MEYLGFDPSTSSLRRTRASNCANTHAVLKTMVKPPPRDDKYILNLLKLVRAKKYYKYGVSGFRSQYLVLAKDARFQLRQYPVLSVKKIICSANVLRLHFSAFVQFGIRLDGRAV